MSFSPKMADKIDLIAGQQTVATSSLHAKQEVTSCVGTGESPVVQTPQHSVTSGDESIYSNLHHTWSSAPSLPDSCRSSILCRNCLDPSNHCLEAACKSDDNASNCCNNCNSYVNYNTNRMNELNEFWTEDMDLDPDALAQNFHPNDLNSDARSSVVNVFDRC